VLRPQLREHVGHLGIHELREREARLLVLAPIRGVPDVGREQGCDEALSSIGDGADAGEEASAAV
jgi:hypothetical protein